MGGGAEDTLVDDNIFTGNYGTNIVDSGGYNNTISNNTSQICAVLNFGVILATRNGSRYLDFC